MKTLFFKLFLLTIGLFSVNNLISQTTSADFYNVEPNHGNGLRFWSSDYYKIHMGNGSNYWYGPVTNYSIKMNMYDSPARGWTWGVYNAPPVAALNTEGTMQLKKDLFVMGNLGIGTSLPSSNLEIRSDNPGLRLTDYDGGIGGTEVIQFGQMESGTYVNTGYIGDGTSLAKTLMIGTYPNIDFCIGVNGRHAYLDPSLYVKASNGYVGINKSTPGYLLDVNGDINFSGTLRQNGTAVNFNSYWEGDEGGITYMNGNAGIGTTTLLDKFNVNGSIRLADAGGYLKKVKGIFFTWHSSYGTQFQHGIFSTDGDDYSDDITLNSYGNIRINFDSNNNGTNNFTIGHSNTGLSNTLLTLNESGQLGIGKTPTQKLDVSGNINFTGSLLHNGTVIDLNRLWEEESSGIAFYNGEVGIGRAPNFDLDVNGDINFTGNLRRNGQIVSLGGSSVWNEVTNGIYYSAGNAGMGTNPVSNIKLNIYSNSASVNQGQKILIDHPSSRPIDEYLVGTDIQVNYPGGNYSTIVAGVSSMVTSNDIDGVSYGGRFINLSTTIEPTHFGVTGTADQNNGVGVSGGSVNGIGVRGFSVNGIGIRAISTNGIALDVDGTSTFSKKISIGPTSCPDGYIVSVEGGLISDRIKVQLPGEWPDYVFSSNYKLLSLKEVESYIETNNHLPDVPSSKQVKEEGIDLGEMNAMLLQKIEEQTLYIIEMNKQLEVLKEEVEALKKD